MYKIIIDDLSVNEEFETRKEAREYIEDSYDNWCADDVDIAENLIYPLICYDNSDEWDEEDDNYVLHI